MGTTRVRGAWRLGTSAGILLGAWLGAGAATAADEAAAGRDIVKNWQETVVTVRLVVTTRIVMGGREMRKTESRVETAGTVIDPSGLAVFSLFAANPGEMVMRMMSRPGGGDGPGFQMETSPGEVKIRWADGQEVPAQIVLQDKDLDVAFVRPAVPLAKPAPALDLTSTAEPRMLDPIVVVSRLGRAGSWAPSASLGRIRAIIDKPRTFYVPESGGGSGATGTPAFTLDGRLIGIVLMRTAPPEGESRPSPWSGGLEGLGMLPVVVPAADIREVAKQVPAK